MAHILLLTLVFAPDGVSTSVLMSELALGLQEQGHKVTVLTTTPHYNVEPEARSRQPLQKRWGRWLWQSDYQGVAAYHAAIPSKGSKIETRLLDYARFHLISTLAGMILVESYDLIITPSPPLTIGLSAWLLKLFRRKPFVYNVQEIYPDIAVSLGVLQNRWLIRVLQYVEHFIYRRAKVVTVISERFKQDLLAKGVPAGKITVIPNFVDTEFISPGERHNAFASQHKLEDKFIVSYAGNIGLTQSFETILAAVKLLAHEPRLHFLFVGDGTRRDWLVEQLAQNPLPNVTLLPYQSRSVVPQIYAASDLCLVPLKRGTDRETFPSKIYTIMAAGRPVLATTDPDSELAWIIQQAECGWIVPPDDSENLAGAIFQAMQQPERLVKMGQQARTYVETHHSRQAIIAQYDLLIRQLTNG